MPEALLKMANLCELYQVTRFTIRRWYKSGLIPAPIRVNRSLRWVRAQVEAALAAAAAEKPVKAEA